MKAFGLLGTTRLHRSSWAEASQSARPLASIPAPQKDAGSVAGPRAPVRTRTTACGPLQSRWTSQRHASAESSGPVRHWARTSAAAAISARWHARSGEMVSAGQLASLTPGGGGGLFFPSGGVRPVLANCPVSQLAPSDSAAMWKSRYGIILGTQCTRTRRPTTSSAYDTAMYTELMDPKYSKFPETLWRLLTISSGASEGGTPHAASSMSAYCVLTGFWRTQKSSRSSEASSLSTTLQAQSMSRSRQKPRNTGSQTRASGFSVPTMCRHSTPRSRICSSADELASEWMTWPVPPGACANSPPRLCGSRLPSSSSTGATGCSKKETSRGGSPK
mmetsp:Transcript_104684/g.296259  ORF Transcript_104684/g.296259 Transcript_104684/m.296259 type:complete len:333 (+) Transcript_104684:721-1719(+)